MFTAGIDLYDFPNFFPFDLNGKDEGFINSYFR